MVGFLLSGILLVVLLFAMVAAVLTTGGSNKGAVVSDNTVLHVSLNYPITERSSNSPLDDIRIPGLATTKTLGLNEILTAIHGAKKDDHIKGIYLDMSGLDAGQATIEEIRNALMDFRKSGKFIIAYGEVYTQSAYYLASVASKVYLNPEGIIEFKGFVSEIMFFKGALDKLGIDAQVIKVGTYKSAVEPYILDRMSDANRLQVTSFMGSLYDHFLGNIAASRHISKDSLFVIADSLKVRTADDAVQYRLADGLKYKDEVISALKKLTGTDPKKDIKTVSIEDYSGPQSDDAEPSSNRIAVVYATGEIAGGEGSDEVMGSERLSRTLRKVRTDDKIKAVVLRINSPGGGTLASDVIWREVVLTRKVKPVIVSMGDVAASGGYYIACGADSIFAQPNTITGSIGVFGIIPNMKTLLNEKLGITFDGVKTGHYADMGGIDRPLTPGERLIFQQEVNRIYDGFTRRVADGRKKSREYIHSIAEGRVWSGTEALHNGLVDKLGSIADAVHSAARMAHVSDDYRLVNYPEIKDPIQSLFDTSADKVRDYFTRAQLGEQYVYYQQLKAVTRMSGIQSRLPYSITIR